MFTEDLKAFILKGREERNLEYKSSLDWADPYAKAKIAKGAMGMANIPDGGVIVIGVENDGTPKGMAARDFASFDQNKVQESVNDYADPYVELTVTADHLDGYGDFVVIQVQQFVELPVVCKKTGAENLRRGAIYTRSRRKHETAEVGSQTEMREILERAVTRVVDRRIQWLRERGLLQAPAPYEVTTEHREQFEAELRGL